MRPALVRVQPYSPACPANPHSEAPMVIAASSPLASWSDHGRPARPQYSSVSRGSIMRRKLTLPVEPPVASITALRAWIATSRPSCFATTPVIRPERGCSRNSSTMRCSRRIWTPALRAAASSGHITPAPEDVVVRASGAARRPLCTISQSIGAACCSRGAELPTEMPPPASGALSTNTTPCAFSHSKVGAE